MEDLRQDIRYAFRMLKKNSGFTVLAVLALALGIGANTAIFSLVNAVLLSPLPGVERADRLVQFERLQRGRVMYNFAYPDYLDYRDQNQSFTGVAAHCATPVSFTASTTERIRGDLVSGNYFSTLGVKPALGRLLMPEDDITPGAHPLAVLSYDFWRRAFNSDSNALGQTINLNGHDFTVLGVAARDFKGTLTGASFDVWVPMAMQRQIIPRMSAGILSDRAAGWISLFGRLKPGTSPEQAQAELRTIASQLESSYPATNEGRSLSVITGFGLDSDDRADLRRFLGLLLGVVGLLLLIACGNVANLLLVRASARRREIAVRLTLGATRARLMRQLLTEGLLLSVLGGALGLLLAPWAAALIVALQQPAYALRGITLSPDLRVLAFTLCISLLTGIVFGLVPALQSSKPDLVASLKDGARSAGQRRPRLQKLLVVAQVSLSLVLLISAGLAVRTMQKVLAADRGFKTENMLLMSLDLSIQGYAEPQGKALYDQLIKRLENVPGVESASLAKTVPPNDWSDGVSIFYEGQAPPQEVLRGRDDLGLKVEVNRIAPHYFHTLGIALLQGRDFSDQDKEGASYVAIISEKLAQKLWPGESAIGRRIAIPDYSAPTRPSVEIIGVAKDTKYRSLMTEAPLLLYLPESQNYDGRATVVIRTITDALSFVSAIRDEVTALDKNLPLFSVKTMSDQIASTLWQQRMAAGLIGIFGLLALVLAAVGLYGVMAHTVAQRTQEIGIRMALGATSTDVLKLVVKEGLALAIAGVIIGIAAAFACTRLMSNVIYGVSATDITTFTTASMLLAAVALAASYIPARRATKVDPMVALKYE
ncbi:MAG: ABC transporter permease [Blastocatellia bacterium]